MEFFLEKLLFYYALVAHHTDDFGKYAPCCLKMKRENDAILHGGLRCKKGC